MTGKSIDELTAALAALSARLDALEVRSAIDAGTSHVAQAIAYALTNTLTNSGALDTEGLADEIDRLVAIMGALPQPALGSESADRRARTILASFGRVVRQRQLAGFGSPANDPS